MKPCSSVIRPTHTHTHIHYTRQHISREYSKRKKKATRNQCFSDDGSFSSRGEHFQTNRKYKKKKTTLNRKKKETGIFLFVFRLFCTCKSWLTWSTSFTWLWIKRKQKITQPIISSPFFWNFWLDLISLFVEPISWCQEEKHLTWTKHFFFFVCLFVFFQSLSLFCLNDYNFSLF